MERYTKQEENNKIVRRYTLDRRWENEIQIQTNVVGSFISLLFYIRKSMLMCLSSDVCTR